MSTFMYLFEIEKASIYVDPKILFNWNIWIHVLYSLIIYIIECILDKVLEKIRF